MGLSTSLNIAQAALATNANLSSVVSRNIAGVNETGYSRKLANVATVADGTGALVSITRATDAALFGNLLSATSDAASSSALASGLDTLEGTVGLNSTSSITDTATSSPATLVSTLTDALRHYAETPGDTAAGQAVVSGAKTLTASLNAASATVQGVRAQADGDIATAVADVNSLLAQFQTVNTAIVKAGRTGGDVTDALDQRDKILLSLSSDLGISTVASADGGLSIYTDSGVTLFQGSPRTVTFTPTTTFTTGTTGAAVTVDGVPVTGASATMGLKSGKIAGLAALRDGATVDYQKQLDQIAGGLIDAFAESDQSGGTAPTIPGLFTYAGGPAMPIAGQSGLANSITLNANADPSQGGSLSRIRDGNVGNPGNAAYNGNGTGAASYTAHLTALLGGLGTTRSFDATSGGAARGTLAAYATSSLSWLEAARQSATATSTGRSAVAAATTASLSGSTGVNLDEQLSLMLDLEHSYQASAELMSTVKGMYASLLNAMQ